MAVRPIPVVDAHAVDRHRQTIAEPSEIALEPLGLMPGHDDKATRATRHRATDDVLDQRHPGKQCQRLGIGHGAQPGAMPGRQDQALHSAASASSAMNSSVSMAATSSLNCCGGCLQKNAEGPVSAPPMPRSSATLQQRTASSTTAAELGLSSTDNRSSRFIGTPPNNSPSSRRKHSLLSFSQGM